MFEQPLPILFVGVLAFGILAAIWTQTRQRGVLMAAGAAAAVTALLLVVERLVVTDAERVEAQVHQIADAVRDNDVQAVLSSIAPDRPALRQQVRQVLENVTVERVSIKSNLRVVVSRGRDGLVAEARFNAVATVADRRGAIGSQIVPRYVVVRFRKFEQNWLVQSYELLDPRQ